MYQIAERKGDLVTRFFLMMLLMQLCFQILSYFKMFLSWTNIFNVKPTTYNKYLYVRKGEPNIQIFYTSCLIKVFIFLC